LVQQDNKLSWARENKALIDSTREQYHLAKEAKEAKEKA